MKKVFISYSSKDYKWLEQLEKHLSSPTVRLWADVNIRPGEDWNQSVKDSIEASDFAIVLISPSYLASKMIDNELQIIFERSNQGKLQVLPVIASLEDASFKTEVNRIFKKHSLISENSLAADTNEDIYRILLGRLNPSSETLPESGNGINNILKWFSAFTQPKNDRPREDAIVNRGSDLRRNIFFEIEEKLARQEQDKANSET
jgi:sugar-specific transcriptional regulator TrmB